jgi:hypothetical protein
MEFSLMNIERRLKEWIEKNTDRISGKNILNELAHSLISIMKDHLVITSNGGCLAPSHYVVMFNPEDRMNPNVADKLATRLLQTLHQVALENEITFAHEPSIKIEYDSSIKKHEFAVDVMEKQGLEDTARMVLPFSVISENHTEKSSIQYILKINDEEFYSLNQLTTNIGRHPDNQLVISDPRISRHHAQLRMTENRFILSDLNSTGGTYVNGEQITQREIKPGDIISLAGFPLIFMETIQNRNDFENEKSK